MFVFDDETSKQDKLYFKKKWQLEGKHLNPLFPNTGRDKGVC